MTTYSKETALYNNDAIASDISDAGNAYKAVVTEVGTTGVKIHPSSQSGNNIVDYTLIDDDGLEVYDGGTSVAAFGEDGARIGKAYVANANDNESHVEIDYRSLKLVDKEGSAYFHVSDLRDSDGLATVTETFKGDGLTKDFFVQMTVSEVVSASDSNGNTASFVSGSNTRFTFSAAPAANAIITIVYKTQSDYAKAFTLGTRNSEYQIGAMSYSEGNGNVASGFVSHAEGSACRATGRYSHAEGHSSKALGDSAHAEGYATKADGSGSHSEGYLTEASSYSHAEGFHSNASGIGSHAEGSYCVASGLSSHAQNNYTIAASDNQTAIGIYNVEDANGAYALIIGNGTGTNARSNALTVSWNGSIACNGWLNPGHPVELAYGGSGQTGTTTTTTISNILTAKSGVTITSASYAQWGKLAALYVVAKKNAALTAGTHNAMATVNAGKRPPFEMGGVGPGGNSDISLAADGTLNYRPNTTVAANTNVYMRIMYLLA